jgi:peptide/nickel transport system substrate-binding protein
MVNQMFIKCCLFKRFILLFLFTASTGCLGDAHEQQYISNDVVQIAVSDIPTSFSPYINYQLKEHYAHLFFDPLLRWKGDQQLEPRLVEKWEKIAPDVMRFYLKKKINFHSGNELTSEDVLWTFAEIKRDTTVNLYFDDIDHITAQSSFIFDVHSKLSEEQVLDYLTHFFVLDSKFYADNRDNVNRELVGGVVPGNTLYLSGTGPYLLNHYNPNTHLNVLKNEKYWENNTSSLALSFIKVKSAQSRLFALLSYDVDISSKIPDRMLDNIRFSTSKSVVRIASPTAMLFTINDNKTPVFKQKKARDAINLAINKVGMLKHIANGTGRTASTFIPSSENSQANNKPYLPSYNVDKSAYYLKQLQVPKQLSLLVMGGDFGHTQEVANELTKMMSSVGIQLTTMTVSTIDEWKKVQFDYDFTLSPWQSTLIDSDNIYHAIFVNSCLADFIEHLFVEAKAAGSTDSRAKVFELAQLDNKIIPLFFENQIWASDNKYNLDEVFSANGIPYWERLKRKTLPLLSNSTSID